ncbi:MAG: M28 family peptidase [Pseudomonadota bacterium]
MRWLACLFLVAACAEFNRPIYPEVTSIAISDPLEVTRILAADDMEGRETGTAGNNKARAWLLDQMRARPFDMIGEDFQHDFEFVRDGKSTIGVNIVGRIPGSSDERGPVMVVTAHYDHVGVIDGEIYNGADDNASGVAGALAIADHFFANPPKNDVVIALLDAEEKGLLGAVAFLRDEVVTVSDIALNINLDMISKNDKRELYVAGGYHTPVLQPLLDQLADTAPVTLKQGHDSPDLGVDDWTLQSDHALFHKAGIPFLYFGVEDHPDYHQPTDDYETIPEAFFRDSVETVVMAAEELDSNLQDIGASKAR